MSLIEVAKAGGVRSLHLVKHPSQDAASAPASKPSPIDKTLCSWRAYRGFKFGLFNAAAARNRCGVRSS